MKKLRLILEKNLKTKRKFSEKELRDIEAAMLEYALSRVLEYKDDELKTALKYSVTGLPKICIENISLLIRKASFNMAKKNAILRAKTENRKIYVIRESRFRYAILSTYDIKFNKKTRRIKNVNAKDLLDVADYIAFPASK